MFKKLLVAAGVLLATLTGASASTREVQVINHTSHEFTYILGSNVGEGNWQYDFLGERVLPPHSNMWIYVDDGNGWCKFDLKATNPESGWHAEIWNMNVCAQHEWHIW